MPNTITAATRSTPKATTIAGHCGLGRQRATNQKAPTSKNAIARMGED